MREIRFRAWNGHEMWSPRRTEAEMSLRGWRQSDSFVLMQYTGFKDCRGQDVYEGDILEDTEGIGQWRGQVLWDAENGSWVLDAWDAGAEPLADSVGSLTHIGNLYENPEQRGRA